MASGHALLAAALLVLVHRTSAQCCATGCTATSTGISTNYASNCVSGTRLVSAVGGRFGRRARRSRAPLNATQEADAAQRVR
jgi:hypothetical protein